MTSRTDASAPLQGRTILVTGISDGASLAAHGARRIQHAGGQPICTGLGPAGQPDLSERARTHLQTTFESFQATVAEVLGASTPTLACDLSMDASVAQLATTLAERDLQIDGVLHAVAFDRTLGKGTYQPLLDTTRDDFLECMNVSAYSLIALVRELLAAGVLCRGAGVVALSYLGAERVMRHPYKNVGVAKAALERIVSELAVELGRSHGVRVNAVHFSPYSASRAGGAIPGLVDAEKRAQEECPLGNAGPESLGDEVVHLMRPESAITGEIRHVDGGQHLLA